MSKHGYAVSVTGATHERLRSHSRAVGVPMQRLVDGLADDLVALTPEQRTDLVERVRARQGVVARRATAAHIAAKARWSRHASDLFPP